MTTLLCNCNRTMALDAQAIAKALGASADAPATVHTALCRREAPLFQQAAKSGDDLLVAELERRGWCCIPPIDTLEEEQG
jgi:hypothetical protein